MRDEGLEAQEFTHAFPVDRETGAVGADGACGAGIEIREEAGEALGVPLEGVDEAEEVVAKRGRVGVLKVGKVGHQGVLMAGAEAGGGIKEFDEGVLQA